MVRSQAAYLPPSNTRKPARVIGAGIGPGWHKPYCRARRADVNCFTIEAVHGSVNGGRFTAPVAPTMIAACEKSLRVRFLEMEA